MVKNFPQYIRRRLSKEGITSSLPLLQLLDAEDSLTQRGAAKRLGLSFGTCNLHFQKLEHLGLIRHTDMVEQKESGRSATVWEMARQENGFLLILIRTSFIEVALTDFGGTIRFKTRGDISRIKTGKTLLAKMEKLVSEALEAAQKMKCTIRQAQVTVSGILDSESAVVIQCVHVPAIVGIDFSAWVTERFNLPCNNALSGTAFYYGETSRLPPETRVMMVSWDMGIGMVAGAGGQIISCPENLRLSEFGHLRVRPNGRTCYCGKKGCLEAYVGGHAILDILNDPSIRTIDALIAAVQSGHAQALELVRDAARLLGESLTWPLQVTDTEKLLIDGPLSVLLPQFRGAFEAGLEVLFTPDEIRQMSLEVIENSQDVLCLGAFQLARRYFFRPQE